MRNIVKLTNQKQSEKTESGIRDRLAILHKGTVEVVIEVGKIDVLTPTEIIEVKQIHQWKTALGQVLVYGNYYPSHQKRLHLFGDCKNSELINLIKKNCEKFGVSISWEGKVLASKEYSKLRDLEYATKVCIKINEKLTVQAYRLQNGEIRPSLSSISILLGHHPNWLSRVLECKKSTYRELIKKGFTSQVKEFRTGGASKIVTVSFDDFLTIVEYEMDNNPAFFCKWFESMSKNTMLETIANEIKLQIAN